MGTSMQPREHQIEGARWTLDTLRKYGLAYLAWQERTGKTLTALLAIENSKAETCLIITKKKAIPGWRDTLRQWKHVTEFSVVNYESLHKVSSKFDAVILDESHHAISGIGRRSQAWKQARRFTKGKAVIYLSATPYAEHLGLIEPQLALSDWSPIKYKSFYDFYRIYGIPNMVRTPYGLIDQRNKYHDEDILKKILPIMNFKTRKDVEIKVEPEVRVIKLLLAKSTEKLIEHLKESQIIELKDKTILADSDMKLRTLHYQLEGGTIKTEDGILTTGSWEKIDYIKAHYDLSKIAIMAHFIAERHYLKEFLPDTIILSSDGDAEGVDLSTIDKLIVYSMSFKTSKHTQRIARQANHNRIKPIVVDILVADKPGIGLAVYESVAVKKENFIKNSYERAIK